MLVLIWHVVICLVITSGIVAYDYRYRTIHLTWEQIAKIYFLAIIPVLNVIFLLVAVITWVGTRPFWSKVAFPPKGPPK